MRIVLLTSAELRHRYVAKRLAEWCDLVGVVSETKSAVVAAPDLLSADDRSVIDAHFAERDGVERRLLGEIEQFPRTDVLRVPAGSINNPDVVNWVSRHEPEIVVLYGTGIVKAPLLDLYPERIINIHLGLSPYYRGSGTNFWPLVNREPECVGTTIHLAVAKVDAGPILAQVRPEAQLTDGAHDLGTKALTATLDVMPTVLSSFVRGELLPVHQNLTQGQIFKNRDFNADAVRTMRANFETGMMSDYLKEVRSRRERFPIIEPAVLACAEALSC